MREVCWSRVSAALAVQSLQFAGLRESDYCLRLSRLGQDDYALMNVFSTPPDTFCSLAGRSKRLQARLLVFLTLPKS